MATADGSVHGSPGARHAPGAARPTVTPTVTRALAGGVAGGVPGRAGRRAAPEAGGGAGGLAGGRVIEVLTEGQRARLGGPGGASSRYLANNFGRTDRDPDVEAAQNAGRTARWDLRRGLWRVTKLPRLAHCGRYLTSDYTRVHIKAGSAYFCDVQTCGSVWACPVCSASIRQRRAVQVESIVGRHLTAGGSAGFLTLTFPHSRGDDLAEMLTTLTGCWAKVQQRRGYRAAVADLGMAGFVRATEVTFGGWHGWHPHLHNLLVADRAVTGEQWAALREVVSTAWADVVVKAGRNRPGEEVGVTLGEVTTAGVGRYLTKVQDSFDVGGIGREVMRGDLKRGRKQSRTPFELAVSAVAGVVPDLPLWWEYERATKGRRAVAISRALRERYGIEDQEDEDLAKADADGEAVCSVSDRQYALLVKGRQETRLLDLAQDGGAPAVHAFLAGLEETAA